MSMNGMVAVVVGSSRGIGKAIARAYGAEGAKVVVVARTTQEGGRLPGTIHDAVREIQEAGAEAMAVQCDATDEEQVKALAGSVLEAYGQIDVLVNNAAIRVNQRLLDMEPRHWDLTMRVNLRGPFLCCKYLVPPIVERGKGSVINVTSGAGDRVGPTGISYSVSKAGLNIMSRGLAMELAEHDIAVNAWNPGPVKTEGAIFTSSADFDWAGWDPPEAVGPSTVWLALQTAQTFTGQVVDRREFGVSWGQ